MNIFQAIFGRFQFCEPGLLIDDDLELVPPHISMIEEVLASCGHPMTRLQAPDDAQISREQLTAFLAGAPNGRGYRYTGGAKVPQYHFWMRLRDAHWRQPGSPPIRIVGGVGLRISSTPSIERYYGHIGYHVYPAARGHRYAERACRLLLPLARHHGFKRIWLTCNPDNIASRRTLERLGARYVEDVPVPEDDPLYERGEIIKSRYRLELSRGAS